MTTQTEEPTAAEPETIEQVGPIPWHGVLAPEGVWSGDKRRFAEGSLEFRDLPLPLTWQKVSADGHKQSVVVGDISAVEKVGNLWEASGTFLQTPEADEVVGLISHFGRFGVSIDADNGEFEIDEDAGAVTFTKARGCSACIVPIPAFQEAYVAIGERVSEALVAAGISDKPWDGSAGRFTPEQWKASCILHVCDGAEKSCHKLPIREPGGALSRAGVHAAASRFGQVDAPAEAKAKAKSSLRGAYKQLGEEPPEAIAAAQALEVYDPVTGQVVTFKRGPGWVTHPADTKRIHDYWTKPGEPGYAKIAWGTPDDFYRCRALVGEKIATNSPEDMRYINQICARWHKDALGFWPGEHSAAVTVEAAITAAGEQGLEVLTEHGQVTEPGSVSLVAAATSTVPASWFADPELKEPTHLTVTEDGRVFGHIALWQTCHIGFQDMCVTPPESGSSYAYFLTKEVLTDQGPVSTGVISLGGGHAGSKLRAAAAVAHYDSTSTGVADVAVGEDEHGIWCAGRVRPGVSPDIVSVIRASDVSGDWRKIGDHKELVAVLAVNVAGFPVPRTRVGVDNGEQVSLVAAGMVPKIEGGTYPSVEEIATAVGSYLAALNKRQERLAELRAKVLGGRD